MTTAAMPSRMIPDSLVRAKEYYLPDLPKIKTLLCIRPGLRSSRLLDVKNQLCSLFLSDAPPE